ncbi:hypothetical protein M1567_00085 [Candidatus Marsarchaeota archaeon]|nr:hypothetical protein [Candidatus Marsarchaeota archaeon]
MLVIALAHVSFGATVSLTGLCSYSNVSANTINVTFSLQNSGDFPATGVSLIPKGLGPLASTNISANNIGSIYPNVTKGATFSLSNLPMPGSYILEFVVSYFQGSSNFFAAFPCRFNYDSGNLTDYLAPISANYSSGRLKLGLFNIGSKPINTTINIIAPPEVRYSPKNRSAIINPQSEYNTSFNVSISKLSGLANATLGVSMVAGYAYDGKYYSTLENLYLSSSSSTATSIPSGLLIAGAFIAVFVILIGLIIFSVLRKSKRPGQGQ